MRHPYPDNFVYNDIPRFAIPKGLSFTPTWHWNAVEIVDDAPDAKVLLDAIAAFNRDMPTVEEARYVDDRTAWLSKTWANKAPAEVVFLIQKKYEAATTVAQKQAVNEEMIELLGWAISALAHQTLER